MQDATGHGRGGRLVMMGTPNRGSFAIALALTGDEKSSRPSTRSTSTTGSASCWRSSTRSRVYQILPSPRSTSATTTEAVRGRAGAQLPVHQAHLDGAQRFQETCTRSIDPERLIYVAGFNLDTP